MTVNFDIDRYRSMMSGATSVGYEFIKFDLIDKNRVNPIPKDSKKCLLRHDVDADISAALTMAQVEHDLGISATYFFMNRSPLYNLLGRQNHMMVLEILKLGHAIGLHYDQGFDIKRGWPSEKTEDEIDREAQWLESQFGTKIDAVSFHQPASAVLQGEISTGGRINTYERDSLINFDYYSDSNRQFLLTNSDTTDATEVVSALAPHNLQLLIHPMWWVYSDSSTQAVWDQAIHSNLRIMQSQLLETERAYGPTRQFNISTC